MPRQAVNPFLPSDEYIPDAEPHVFGDRVYIYGSHDQFNGAIFCLNDYVCYSAPTDDLTDWRFEGTIYHKRQDPKNRLGLRLLFAPDVAQGPDGRFYLYYALDFLGLMGVAVCDTPAGAYQFLGYVRFPDGSLWGRNRGDPFPFDPGVFVDDDGRVYLYSGFYLPIPALVTGGKKLTSNGGVALELESDMLTVKAGPILAFPKTGRGSFAGHEFFEASSMRKIGARYYFIYSSRHNHELCYAVSDSPMGGFAFGGTLVSLGDLFLNGDDGEEAGAVNYLGNTHGSLAQIRGQWYVFYHRQTNRHSYSRQACAERIELSPDGRFSQAEVTSCGLNGGPLLGSGVYEARIACTLRSKTGTGRYDCFAPRWRFRAHPYFTQDAAARDDAPTLYIANLRDGAVAGFRYFAVKNLGAIRLRFRGHAVGEIRVTTDASCANVVARVPITARDGRNWTESEAAISVPDGVHALYFEYAGKGAIDFLSFELRLLTLSEGAAHAHR